MAIFTRRSTKVGLFAAAVAGLAAVSTGMALAVESQPSDAPKAEPAPEFQDEQPKSSVLGLEFWVNDAKSPMRTRAQPPSNTDNGFDVVETQIGTGEFEVRFPKRNSEVALQMVALTGPGSFALEPGMTFENITFLQPGSSMEDKASGRMTLFMHPISHNSYAEGRVQQHSDDQEKVQFEGVKDATTAEPTPVTAGPIFVIAVMDFNGNNVVDTGEFEYFNILLTPTS